MSGPKRTVRAYLTDTLGGTQRPDTPAIVNDMSQAIKTSNVFVPGRYPRHTYNPRSDRELEESLRTYLDDGGAILTLVGPTKTGKTVLLQEVIEDPVWIEAQGIDDAETFWALVGGELGLFVESTTSSEHSDTTTAGGKIGLPGVFEGGGDHTFGSTSGAGQVAVRVAGAEARKRLQESGRVLVVDDFHFIDRAVQREIVRAVKPLLFNDVRVVFAAISHRVHDVPQAVEDMLGRTDPLEIVLWKGEELVVIAERGFAVLNVVDHGGELARKLAENSFGSPHLMQKLCRELVRGVNGISQAADTALDLHAPTDWEDFFSAQVEDYAGQWFTRLLTGPNSRGTERTMYRLRDGREVDGYGLILVAAASMAPQLSITRTELNAAIADLVVDAQPEGHQLTRFLNHMTRIAKRNLHEDVLPEELLDGEDGALYLYAGVEPVMEYADDESISALNIADPFFAYYMRWGAGEHIKAHGEPTSPSDRRTTSDTSTRNSEGSPTSV